MSFPFFPSKQRGLCSFAGYLRFDLAGSVLFGLVGQKRESDMSKGGSKIKA